MKTDVVQGDLLDQDVDVIVNAWNLSGLEAVLEWWVVGLGVGGEGKQKEVQNETGGCTHRSPSIRRVRMSQVANDLIG